MRKSKKILTAALVVTMTLGNMYGVFAMGNENVVLAKEESVSELGDINGDAQITLTDAQLSLKAALNIISVDEDDIKIHDVDKNGEITLADAQLILMKATRIIRDFPVNTMKMKVKKVEWLEQYQNVLDEQSKDAGVDSMDNVSLFYLDDDDIPEMINNTTGQLYTYREGNVIPVTYDIARYYCGVDGYYEYEEKQSLIVFYKEDSEYYMKLNNNELRLYDFNPEKDGEFSHMHTIAAGNVIEAYLGYFGGTCVISDCDIVVDAYFDETLRIRTDKIDVISMGEPIYQDYSGPVEYIANTVTDNLIEVTALYGDGVYRYIQVIVEPDGNTIVQECYEETVPKETTVSVDGHDVVIREFRNGAIRIYSNRKGIIIGNNNAVEMHGTIKNIEIKSLTEINAEVVVTYADGSVRVVRYITESNEEYAVDWEGDWWEIEN